MTAYRRVCGWCGTVLGGPEDAPVSHGVCQTCKKELLPVFLDTVEDAALLLGDDRLAQSANKKAREASGKDLLGIEGKAYGDIFDCRHASLPDSCGKTAECSGCSVRVRVEDTYKTGQRHEMVPALIRRRDGTELRLTISTLRLAKGVLLTIHEGGAPIP